MTALSSKSVAWHDDAASDGAESEGTQDVTDAFDSFSMGGHYAQPSADSVSGFEDRPERSAPSQRRIKKANRLRERFGIPADEPFIDVYLCALKGGFLQQGRLYVYQQHVCFHANVFGHHTHLCIPGKEIHRLDKCSNLGFPNSIRVRYGTKKVIFSSFLKRHEAYNDIARCASLPVDQEEEGTVEKMKAPVKWLVDKINRESPSSGGGEAEAETDLCAEAQTGGEEEELGEEGDEDSASSEEGSVVKQLQNGSGDGLTPLPKRPETMTEVKSFELPCTLQTFWDTFLSDRSRFWKSFHEACGEQSVKLSRWHGVQGAVMRDLEFVKMLSGGLGADRAYCSQTQRLSVHRGPSLLFQSCQVMNDIPYADHFTVETFWTLESVPSKKAVKISACVGVPFTKRTMLKSVIEKGARSGAVEALEKWREQALKTLSHGGGDSAARKPGAEDSASAPTSPRRHGELRLHRMPSATVRIPSFKTSSPTTTLYALVGLVLLVAVLQLLLLARLSSLRASPGACQIEPSWASVAGTHAELAELAERTQVLAARLEQWRAALRKMHEP
ncbi:hypothetical protein H632_c306p0 [Helicosporidium sp. ATCC 50920]|nr:hypothetical protein H632_c306p0 [Helicosporidium sp. ATCC 50920]|eukprot:KDD76231.1 hypothetical protein H632_c306p0 [Helicosporidium sp. ATCC 50920]